jgi:homoserine O-acetyltransferase/O-succinyltransferase
VITTETLTTTTDVASGIWHEGDPPGSRRWVTLPQPLHLEAGGMLTGVRMAFETWGTLAPDATNAVLLLHGLTGDSHVAGPAGVGHPTAGWWDQLVGPGKPLDPDRWFLVAPNVLGGCQGSTGPSSPAPDGKAWGSRFPFLTIRDQVAAEAGVADALGIQRWAAVIGGSMGGMRALEWAATYPQRVAKVVPIACSAASTADQIAWAAPQIQAIIDDPAWLEGDYYEGSGTGPWRGLGTARRIAHVTYRSGPELTLRFGRRYQGSSDQPRNGCLGSPVVSRYAVESYLDHHAAKLIRRFDAGSYVVLTNAMNSHDVGRDRGGVTAALSRVTARAMVIGVDSDRLFPLAEQERLASGLPDCGPVRVVTSTCGHDGFLVEQAQVGALLRDFLLIRLVRKPRS